MKDNIQFRKHRDLTDNENEIIDAFWKELEENYTNLYVDDMFVNVDVIAAAFTNAQVAVRLNKGLV